MGVRPPTSPGMADFSRMMGCTPETGNRHSVGARWLKLHAVTVFEEMFGSVCAGTVIKTTGVSFKTWGFLFCFRRFFAFVTCDPPMKSIIERRLSPPCRS
jgi:hypothetical protein